MRIGLAARRLAVIACTCLLVVACSSGKASTSATISTGAPSSGGGKSGTLKPGTYKIGIDVPETGAIGFAGKSIVAGANAALDKINSSGYLGNGVKLELVKVDDQSDPTKAVAGTTTIDDAGAVADICCYTSGISGPIKPVAIQKKLPLIGGGAALPGFNEPPYVYRIIPLNGPEAFAPMVKSFLASKQPKHMVAILASDNQGFTSEVQSYLQPAQAAGVKTDTVNVSDKDTDFSGAVTNALGLNPDVVVVEVTHGAALIKAIRDQGYKGAIMSNPSLSTPDAWQTSGGTLQNVFYPENLFLTQQSARGKDFNAAMTAATGQPGDLFASYGWEQVFFVADALAQTTDGTREQLVDALSKITTFDSVFGPMKLDNGQGELTLPTPVATFDANGNRVPATL